MSYITTGERIVYERGTTTKRVGELPKDVKTDIQALSLE
jgi:hypothetical protein